MHEWNSSSKILATRIQKEIPEIEQLQNLSLFEVGLIPKSQYDLIISTIPLPIEPNEYLIVSPLLPKDDIQKIKYSVQNLKKAIRRTDHSQKNSSSFSQKAIEQLRAMQRYVNHTLEILDGFHYQMINNDRKSVPVIVKEMIDELAQQGFINNKEEVVRRLLHRERLGGLGIPGTDFAFFHTRTDEVGKPSFTIYSLSTPILLKSMDNHDIEIRKILLLIGPQSISSEGMEVLSEISSLLIEEDTVKRFETENEQEIVDYFSIRLQEFCYQKIRVER
ncbi:PTS sugar transporter subunit IIA [Caldalkalibacillus mannanilyticus]|uniref:PTS sugar transporter subunit IIA n=1 Tax=Caldalkalibacillus mannanilyticus TaxID=1418 RepID=UPI000AEE6DC5|nr:PTS sugar transporter subunit IIA [Caldalkalibacillus mannanilyticus]